MGLGDSSDFSSSPKKPFYDLEVAAGKGPSRIVLTLRSLIVMGVFGASLALYGVYTNKRDLDLSFGPQGASQEAFFVQAADQPDIKNFYRKLSDSQKVLMARNIGRYRDFELAKLCAILLGDFSPEAREALTQALTAIAIVHPEAVAAQLGRSGSFEQFGIRKALEAVGAAGIPKIVDALSDDAMRPNAEDLLVAEGSRTVPSIVPLLSSKDPNLQNAAAEILGKLRSRVAVRQIESLYRQAPPKQGKAFLVAIASIGDSTSESLLTQVLSDSSADADLRTQAAFGLGRIASESAVKSLWSHAWSEDSGISQGCLAALLLCGDRALSDLGQSQAEKLGVAAGTHSPMADKIIGRDLNDPHLSPIAVKAAAGRPALEPALVSVLKDATNQANGEFADLAIQSLMSTQAGRIALKALKNRPELYGLIERRERIGPEGG